MQHHGRTTHLSHSFSLIWRGAHHAFLLGLSLLLLAGCNANSSAPSDGAYVERYNHGEYAAAKLEAEAIYKTTTGDARQQAGLIAGLSSQSLGQTADAKKYLRPLLSSKDNAVAGRAGAALGIIARGEGDKVNSAKLFSDAAPKLSGDESAKAAMFAGDAYKSQGKTEAANSQYAAAMQVAMSDTLKKQLQDRMSNRKFTVQVGAFSSRVNADKRLKEVAAKTAAAGLGQPRIVATTAGGKSVFVVQVGEFALRQDAGAAMNRLGVSEGKAAEVN
ncbi:MAG: SPOR domain-containing protein [Pyrinomonadaceae bacterium]|nr:SPOR domain-containing protein [Phycisphaerales bacterium]